MNDLDFIKEIKKVLSTPTLSEQGVLLEPSLMNALELLDEFKKSVVKTYLKQKNTTKNEHRKNEKRPKTTV